MPQPLCAALLAKIEEQLDLVLGMLEAGSHVPANWTPPLAGARQAGWLFGHLVECAAGVCAVLYAAHREELARFERLRAEPVNVARTQTEASARLLEYREHIRQGFAVLRDEDLGRLVPTVFVKQGEAILTLLLGNFEHLVSHKYQLGVYLKLAGVELGTRDFYRFRGQ